MCYSSLASQPSHAMHMEDYKTGRIPQDNAKLIIVNTISRGQVARGHYRHIHPSSTVGGILALGVKSYNYIMV